MIFFGRCFKRFLAVCSAQDFGGLKRTKDCKKRHRMGFVVENEPLKAVEQKYPPGDGMPLGFLVNRLDRYIAIWQEML